MRKYHVFEMYGANFYHQGEFKTLDEARIVAASPDVNGMRRRCMIIQGELVESDVISKDEK